MVKKIFCFVAILMAAATGRANVATFDDLTLGANSSWNGSDGSGGFTSGQASFNNAYDPDSWSWGGFGYSNIQDGTTPGWAGEFNAITGGAQSGANYAVGYYDTFNNVYPVMTLNTPLTLDGCYITNTNWAYYFVMEGDSYFMKPAYGPDDYLLLTITGRDAGGNETAATSLYLADYTNDNSLVLSDWQWVDLSGLGEVASVDFIISTNRPFTPLYFAMDTVVPEPVTLALLMGGAVMMRRR